MSEYSELMGSFIRTGNYSLEADYTFKSEDELISFYSIPENKALLHEGLFKVVTGPQEQSLYWIVQKDEGLEFNKLISTSISDSLSKLGTIVLGFSDGGTASMGVVGAPSNSYYNGRGTGEFDETESSAEEGENV